MKICCTVPSWLLAHGLALLAQPSGQGAWAGPCQRRCGARPCHGHHAQRALASGLAVTGRRQGPASGHGEGPGTAPGMVMRWGAH
jgi:hypothetical protein